EEEESADSDAPEEIRIDTPKEESKEKGSIAELEKKLQKALEKEDYEKASKLRDEINRRSKK
ncbi:MAG: UvrB/UvrC motif-containing protein, partial [Cryomorphaceae bacterium]